MSWEELLAMGGGEGAGRVWDGMLGVEGRRCSGSTGWLEMPWGSGGLHRGVIGAWRKGRVSKSAGCQGREGVVWSGMLNDGNSVILLLWGRLGTGEMGFEGAGGEVVLGNGRRSSYGGLRNTRHKGVGAGCLGT